MPVIPTPWGRRVRIVDEGSGPPVVFLHGGVGSTAEWNAVLPRWPDHHRRIAVDAYGVEDGPYWDRTIDDYVDQVLGVVDHVGSAVHLVGFSWGGATALRLATTQPETLASLTVIEPQAYSLLLDEQPDAYTEIAGMRDRWREHVAAGRWHEAFAAFIDHYNHPGSFDAWPAGRRGAFLSEQQARGDLWDILFDNPLTPQSLRTIDVPTLVVEGGATMPLEQALCAVVRRHVPSCRHVVIDGAGHMMPLTHPDELVVVVAPHVEAAVTAGA